jgi:protein gp37
MAENSKIEWTHHTFNPWSGCTKVSPGCANCYAESHYSTKVRGVKWGPSGNRIVKAEAGWKEPGVWNKYAAEGRCVACRGKGYTTESMTEEKDGYPLCDECGGSGKVAPYRSRVFCASLADFFEDWRGPMLNSSGDPLFRNTLRDEPWTDGNNDKPGAFSSVTMSDVRRRLFDLIDETPNLDWLILSKRPENFAKMMPPINPIGDHPFGGVTVQTRDGRSNVATVGKLVAERAIARGEVVEVSGVRPNVWLGVSVEDQPRADERIPYLLQTPAAVRFLSIEPLLGPVGIDPRFITPIEGTSQHGQRFIDWVIIGGESGHGARPCNLEWIRDLVRQCKAAGVACFVKQMGANLCDLDSSWREGDRVATFKLRDPKGGSPEEWPEDLRIREFPKEGVSNVSPASQGRRSGRVNG